MDVVNFDALIAQERKITTSQVDLDEDYFILGHYDPRRREFKATDYPIYAISARDILAPAINNKDRQIATAATSASTSTISLTYVDLANMTLTTNELDPVLTGATGNYQIFFSASYALSDILSSGQFILNINGLDIAGTEITEFPSAGTYRTNIIWQVPVLAAGLVIKVRYRVIPGNPGASLTVYNRTLMIDGANSQTII